MLSAARPGTEAFKKILPQNFERFPFGYPTELAATPTEIGLSNEAAF